jgi:hypothetical protein
MKHQLSRPTSEHRNLLSQVESLGGSSRRPLYLDDITTLARMRLVCFDGEGALKLTDKGRAALKLQ